ncbi:hypothetical protein [Methylobacterium sp. SD21]|uniref:hypothetical protein n=1 Tax=Methylobacterium litchii TaxID=3138810 RepID=UPI00313E4AB9
MKTVNLITRGKAETLAARLQAEGYVPTLKMYEYQDATRLLMQWDRQDKVPGGKINRSIWLTDDGYLAPEVSFPGRSDPDIEGHFTLDIETALAEIERLTAEAKATIAQVAA